MAANRMLLALGSNINPEQNLPAAVRLLRACGRIIASSQVWQSAPVGFLEQPDFLNAAVLLETQRSPQQIIGETIPSIERALGRQRDPGNKNAPRTIDVDLVMVDGFRGRVLGHEIPEPEILTRAFLARPLAEVAPTWTYPGNVVEELQQIAQRLETNSPALVKRDDINLQSDTCAPLEDKLCGEQ